MAKRKEAMSQMTKEDLKTFVDETNLCKRKTKGVFRKREATMSQILFPGVAPQEYMDKEPLQIMVDLVDSGKTNLPFEYYRLPVCQRNTWTRSHCRLWWIWWIRARPICRLSTTGFRCVKGKIRIISCLVDSGARGRILVRS